MGISVCIFKIIEELLPVSPCFVPEVVHGILMILYQQVIIFGLLCCEFELRNHKIAWRSGIRGNSSIAAGF